MGSTMLRSSVSAPWAAPRSSLARRGLASSASSDSRRAMTAAPPMVRPASSASAISSIPPTCRCCAPPIRCGASSRRDPASRCSPSPALSRSARPTANSSPARCASRLHGLAHECSTRRPDAPLSGVPRAGRLCRRVPAAMAGSCGRSRRSAAQLARAREAGAELRIGEERRSRWNRAERRSRGDAARRHRRRLRAIVTAGPWVKSLLPSSPAPIRVTRQVLGWFEPQADRRHCLRPVAFRCSCCRTRTAFLRLSGRRRRRRQGRQAPSCRREPSTPTAVDRNVSAADEAMIRAMLAAHLPGANGRLLDADDLPLHHDAGRRFHPRPAAGPPERSSWRRHAPGTASSSPR